MLTLPQTKRQQQGSVLVTTLVLCSILGLTLGGYLYWVRTQNVLVSQSQAWNAALAHAEAGIEEAMAQINVGFGTNYLASAQGNWGGGHSSGRFGPRMYSFREGSYSTIILPVVGARGPSIISTGYASVPLVGKPVNRTIMVTTASTTPFANAITVKSNLTCKGNGMLIDSYDSGDPNYSTPEGRYDETKRKAGGDVNSTAGIINVQNATIYGHLRTGPEGTYTIGNGFVGDLNWSTKGQIKPGWYENDFNMEFKEILPPFSSGSDVVKTDYVTNKYFFLGSGNYYVSGNFEMSQNEIMKVQGNTVLYVTGKFNMKSQNECSIDIEPGASLTLYVGVPDGGNTPVTLTQVNVAGNAFNFQFYGLDSTKSLVWNGNNNYVGTVYAPEAAVELGGGGSDPYDFQGSCVAKSGSLNGHFNIHYDENLQRRAIPSGFLVTSWREL